MPKGDRLKLKADPEDGTTPIANLLLEAVAMAKISGLQTRAIIFLWRETYGWVGEDGKRKKEAKIPLSEWARALDSGSSRLSHALGELENMKIINRRLADAWGGYYYSLNTNIAKWNSDSINLSKLAEQASVAYFGTIDQNATIPQTDNSCDIDNSCPKQQATVAQNATQQLPKTQPPLGGTIGGESFSKETLKKDKEIKGDVKITSPIGEKIKEVFTRLDKERGYRPPKRKAEASSIIRMLKTYTPGQIIDTWRIIKQDKFWDGKELFMMTVESQIGAVSHGTHQSNNQIIGQFKGNSGEDRDKYIGGKYGSMVKQ